MVLTLVVGMTLALLGGPAQAAPAQTPSFNGTVFAVAYSGTTIYLGGDFTAAVVRGKAVGRSRLAAVDARTGALLPWAPAADGRVKAIATSGSSVYVAGDFTAVGGKKRDSLARLDSRTGVVSSTFKHTVEGRPYALAAGSGRLYVGGAISAVNGQSRPRLAAFNLSSGVLDTKWKPSADSQVEALATAAGRVYVGGRFRRINGITGYDRLVALDPSSAAIVTGFKPKSPASTFAIAVTSTGVYTAQGGQGGTASSFSTTGATRWTATFDGDAQAVGVLGDTVYVGGHFDHACRTALTGIQGTCLDGSDNRVKLAALAVSDGRLRNWTADANGVIGVLALAVHPGLKSFAVGGAFTTLAGRAQKRFAQLG
jgi:hypothetical protein